MSEPISIDHLSEKAKYDYSLVLKATQNKNQQAFTELMDRYKDSIYFMLLKMINNKDDAEDLTIEAFAKAFKNLHRFKKDFTFSTWLFRIATNNSIDFIRKKKLETFSLNTGLRDEDGEAVTIDVEDKNLDPQEEAIKSQKKELIQMFVTKLPAKYQRLVRLRYFQELSYEEIAEALELPIGTVKTRIFRARDALRQSLGDLFEEPSTDPPIGSTVQ